MKLTSANGISPHRLEAYPIWRTRYGWAGTRAGCQHGSVAGAAVCGLSNGLGTLRTSWREINMTKAAKISAAPKVLIERGALSGPIVLDDTINGTADHDNLTAPRVTTSSSAVTVVTPSPVSAATTSSSAARTTTSISGARGNDILIGENGDDVINGNQGDDTLVGGNGDDGVNGGDGVDTVWYDVPSAASPAASLSTCEQRGSRHRPRHGRPVADRKPGRRRWR